MKKDHQILIKKAIYTLLGHGGLLIFFISELVAFGAGLYLYVHFLYKKFKIHIFDSSTFHNWESISIVDFSISNILAFLLIYFIINIFVSFNNYALGYYLINSIKGNKSSIMRSFLHTIYKIPTVLHLALFLTTISLVYIIELDIKALLYTMIRFIGIPTLITPSLFKELAVDTYLALPVLIDTPRKLKESLNYSKELMKTHFGESPDIHFSTGFIIPIIVAIGVLIERITTALFHQVLGVFMLVVALGSIFLFFNTIKLIVKCFTYLYCIDQPIGIFTREEIKAAYKK